MIVNDFLKISRRVAAIDQMVMLSEEFRTRFQLMDSSLRRLLCAELWIDPLEVESFLMTEVHSELTIELFQAMKSWLESRHRAYTE